MNRHYLDHNATSPMRLEVMDAMVDAFRVGGNASSIHAEGRAARGLVETARQNVRKLVNAPVNGIVFTSGGTEAIHLALNSAVTANGVKRIFLSAIEHPAVEANARATGATIEAIPVTPNGVADLDWLRSRLAGYDNMRDGGFLVCLMIANNETGVIQPVTEAAAITHERGGLIFADAAQAVGKVPVNFVMSGVDMMALTGHKFGGPIGVGALISGPNLPLDPVLKGGGQEMNRRAGTLNVGGISGLGVACEKATESLARADEISDMRDRIETVVANAGAYIWGGSERRLPGTLCFSAPNFAAETQLMALDLAGIAVSSGAACSSGKVTPSHVLMAMGATERQATCAVRVSLGWNSTSADVDAFINAWTAAYARVQTKNSSIARGAA